MALSDMKYYSSQVNSIQQDILSIQSSIPITNVINPNLYQTHAQFAGNCLGEQTRIKNIEIAIPINPPQPIINKDDYGRGLRT